ncbi:alpha/beta hydrolase [Legionella drozanskii]|nr:alpha/beta hydrolase-fold protein [Legionella drozanskii]
MSKCGQCSNEKIRCICPKGLVGGANTEEDEAYSDKVEQVATAILEQYAVIYRQDRDKLSNFINSVRQILNDESDEDLINLLEEGIFLESEAAAFKEEFMNLGPNRAMLVDLSNKLNLEVFPSPGTQLNTGIIEALSVLDKWPPYPDNSGDNFQQALRSYTDYFKDLSPEPERQLILSDIFWKQIEKLGTPIIESNPEKPSECNVYFLLAKDELDESTEEPGTKKDLYLQGDFHGYDTSDGRQKLEEIANTGIMIQKDTILRDAIINYRYIQLEPSLRGRIPLFDLPPFFGLSAKEEATRLMKDVHKILYESGQEYPPTLSERYEELVKEFETLNRHDSSDVAYQRFLDGNPPGLGLTDLTINLCGLEGDPFWFLDNQCPDQYSKHRTAFLGPGPQVKETVFRVNENPKLARLPGKAVVWSDLLSPPEPQSDPKTKFVYHNTFYSKLDGKLHSSDETMKRDASNIDLFHGNDDSPYSDCTRAIHVFKPIDGLIEKVVVVNDGMNYLSIGIMEELEKMAGLSPNTAFVFITTLPGLEKTLSQTNSRAKLQGLGAGRTVDYELQIDDYATFIRDVLFPELNATGVLLPKDPSHRVMIGASLSGTAAIKIGFKHPDLFGGIIAQSPSPSNKSCLNDLIASNNTKKSNVQLHLSCGLFEQPKYAAANANLMFAQELSARFGVEPLHIGANGHYFLAWSKALEQSLPEILNKMCSTHELGATLS